MTLKELCRLSHKMAVEKGFWGKDGKKNRNTSELLMLIVTELGEACEALRKGNSKSEHIPKFSAVEEELADAVIRIADMSQALNYRLQEAIIEKLKFNQKRNFKHDKLF